MVEDGSERHKYDVVLLDQFEFLRVSCDRVHEHLLPLKFWPNLIAQFVFLRRVEFLMDPFRDTFRENFGATRDRTPALASASFLLCFAEL